MTPIPILPSGSKPAPLPTWILDLLVDRDPTPPSSPEINPVQALMDTALASSGLTEGDLCNIVTESMPYNPREGKIHQALKGECADVSFQRTINRILNITDEQWNQANRFRKKISGQPMSFAAYHEKRSKAHYEFRNKGPYLRVLRNRDVPWSFSKQVGYIQNRDLTIDMHGMQDSSPPTAEEMASMISNHPASCHTGFFDKFRTPEHPIIGGYLYHRLPDEMHTFDAKGKHIASGDIYPAFPPNVVF